MGDILFIRSGFVAEYYGLVDGKEGEGEAEGKEEWAKIARREHQIGPEDGQRWAGVAQEERMLDWLHDCYFAAVGGDSPSFEAWPSNRGECVLSQFAPSPFFLFVCWFVRDSFRRRGEWYADPLRFGQSTTSTNTSWRCGACPSVRCWT